MTKTNTWEELVLDAVYEECKKARAKHSPKNSAHEAYAVILEELDEFWDEVKRKRDERKPEAMAEELLQVAAAAVLAIVDLKLVDHVRYR